MGRPPTKRPPQNPMTPNPNIQNPGMGNPHMQFHSPNMNQRTQPAPHGGSFPKDATYIRSHLTEFEKLELEKKREILGEMVYPLVRQHTKLKEEAIPKITGMLIDFEVFEVEEILDFIQFDESLLEKLREAEDMLVSSN